MSPREAGSAAMAERSPAVEAPAKDARSAGKSTLPLPLDKMAVAFDIQTLARAARRGDAEAFSRLYDLYSFRVYKFLLVLARGDDEQAREICQAVFIKLAKRCDVFEDERRFWTWLRALARNTFIDHWRARRRLDRFVSIQDLDAEPASQTDPENALGAALREALALLPPDERELLQAVYVDKRPLQDLADETGQTYKAIESRLGRLRQKLKQQMLKDLRHEHQP